MDVKTQILNQMRHARQGEPNPVHQDGNDLLSCWRSRDG